MSRNAVVLIVFLTLITTKLASKPFSELRHVERADRLYTVVEGYLLRPQKAVRFYEERGNSQAAACAREALALQLHGRHVYRRDITIGALGTMVLGAALGWAFYEESRGYLISRDQNMVLGSFVGATLGNLGGVIVGANHGARYLHQGEAKVAEGVAVWIRMSSEY